MRNYADRVTILLEADIKVMIYVGTGEAPFICDKWTCLDDLLLPWRA